MFSLYQKNIFLASILCKVQLQYNIADNTLSNFARCDKIFVLDEKMDVIAVINKTVVMFSAIFQLSHDKYQCLSGFAEITLFFRSENKENVAEFFGKYGQTKFLCYNNYATPLIKFGNIKK